MRRQNLKKFRSISLLSVIYILLTKIITNSTWVTLYSNKPMERCKMNVQPWTKKKLTDETNNSSSGTYWVWTGLRRRRNCSSDSSASPQDHSKATAEFSKISTQTEQRILDFKQDLLLQQQRQIYKHDLSMFCCSYHVLRYLFGILFRSASELSKFSLMQIWIVSKASRWTS